MDNSKARAIAANNFPEVDFSANTKTQLALIKFQLWKITCYQGMCNNGGAPAIAANNFQNYPNFSNFQILNYKRANWDLVLIQKTCSEKIWPFELWLNGFELSLNAFQKHKET